MGPGNESMRHGNGIAILLYSQKYWWSLSLAVWPQTDRKNILAEFKFGGGVAGPFIKECCCLSLEVLEQSHEFTNYKK